MFEEDGEEFGDVNWIAWWFGWNRLGAIVIGTILCYTLTFALVGLGPGLFLAIIGGLGVHAGGVRYVNQNYASVLEDYQNYIQRRTQNLTSKTNEGVSNYTLTYSSDSLFFVTPAKLYCNCLTDLLGFSRSPPATVF